MSALKRIARHVLREELAALRKKASDIRWETVEDCEANQAAIFEALARLHRGESSRVSMEKTQTLEEWEEKRHQ